MLQPNVPEVRMVWMRRTEVEILDTWHTGGLRGTGSHDVVVKDRLVPRLLTYRRSMAARWQERWVACPSSATWRRVMRRSSSDSRKPRSMRW